MKKKKNNNKYVILLILSLLILGFILIISISIYTSGNNNISGSLKSSKTSSNNLTSALFFTNSHNKVEKIGGQSNNVQVIFSMEAGCSDCAILAKELATISEKYSNVKFYGVDINSADSYSELIPWINSITQGKGNISYVISKNSNFLQEYKVTSLDTLYIINKKGDLVYRSFFPSENSIERTLSFLS